MLCDLDLGPLVAEQEQHVLKDKSMFLQTNSWNEAIKPRTNIILGRKGSGKSAIRIGIQHHLSLQNTYLKEINFSNFKPAEIGDRFNDAQREYPYLHEKILYRNLWQYIIVTAAINTLMHSNASRELKNEIRWAYERLQEPGILPKCLKDTLKFDARLAFIDSLGKIKANASTLDDSDLSDYPITNEFAAIRDSLKRVLGPDCKVLLTLDDFDRDYELFADVVQPMLIGLVNSIHDLKDYFGDKFEYLMVKCFIPSDAFGPKDHRHYDKIKPHTIKWSLLDLSLLVAKRLHPYARQRHSGVSRTPPTADDYIKVLKTIFQYNTAMMWDEYADPIQFLSHLTLERPRDMLEAITICKETATHKNPSAQLITIQDVFASIPKISSSIYNKTLSEYSSKYEELGSIIDLFRGREPRVSRESIAKLIGIDLDSNNDKQNEIELNKWISALYESGFLCRNVSARDYIGSTDDKKVVVASWRDDHTDNTKYATNFIVHRAFWNVLGMRTTNQPRFIYIQ